MVRRSLPRNKNSSAPPEVCKRVASRAKQLPAKSPNPSHLLIFTKSPRSQSQDTERKSRHGQEIASETQQQASSSQDVQTTQAQNGPANDGRRNARSWGHHWSLMRNVAHGQLCACAALRFAFSTSLLYKSAVQATDEPNYFGRFLDLLNEEELIRIRWRAHKANETRVVEIITDELEEREGIERAKSV